MSTTTTLATPTDTGACGTPAGVQRHRRSGQAACEPCRQSRIVQQREYRASRAQVRERFPLTPNDRAAARKALPLTSGILVGRRTWHEFVPMRAKTGVGTLCAACWGWRDDPRHPVLGGPVVGR